MLRNAAIVEGFVKCHVLLTNLDWVHKENPTGEGRHCFPKLLPQTITLFYYAYKYV